MKKERRVKESKEFQEIIGKGKYAAMPSMVAYYDDKKEEYNRIGISVGKKLGNAVQRNLIKRQLRMMLSECGSLELSSDLIVIVRKGYLKNDYATNKKHLESIIKKVKIRTYSDLKER